MLTQSGRARIAPGSRHPVSKTAAAPLWSSSSLFPREKHGERESWGIGEWEYPPHPSLHLPSAPQEQLWCLFLGFSSKTQHAGLDVARFADELPRAVGAGCASWCQSDTSVPGRAAAPSSLACSRRFCGLQLPSPRSDSDRGGFHYLSLAGKNPAEAKTNPPVAHAQTPPEHSTAPAGDERPPCRERPR